MQRQGFVIFLYGVHGSGKTLLGQIFAEDEGFVYIKADAIEFKQDVTKLSPLERQSTFVYSLFTNLPTALNLASSGQPVIFDFGPYQIIPYTEYWIKNEKDRTFIKEILQINYQKIREKYKNVKFIHVFLVVEDESKVNKIIRNILKRNRPNVKEEANPDYVKFINSKFLEISRTLKSQNEEVYNIPADARYIDKYKYLESIVRKYI